MAAEIVGANQFIAQECIASDLQCRFITMASFHISLVQETQEPEDAAVHDDAEDPPASGIKTPPPTASVASPVRDAVEMHTEASPAESIPAAQPDMSAEGSSQEAKAEASRQLEPLGALESQLVGDLEEPHDEPIDTVEPPVPTELPRLDDGFRAGLRLLHTDELRRACLDRGLNFEGTKGTLLNRLLEHFARAPLPTPTQEVSNLKPLEAKVSKVNPATSKQPVAPAAPEAPAQAVQAAPEAVQPDLTAVPEEPVEPPSKKQKLKPQPRAVQIPSEIQQLRPLQSTAKAPVLRTLLSRPRSATAATAVAPNFTALWRTMCPAQQTEAPKSGQGRAGIGKRLVGCSACLSSSYAEKLN